VLDHFAHRGGFGAAVEAVRAVDLADRVVSTLDLVDSERLEELH